MQSCKISKPVLIWSEYDSDITLIILNWNRLLSWYCWPSARAVEDLEEGEASDCVDPSPSRDCHLVKRYQLLKVNDKTRADSTKKAKKGLEEGIQLASGTLQKKSRSRIH